MDASKQQLLDDFHSKMDADRVTKAKVNAGTLAVDLSDIQFYASGLLVTGGDSRSLTPRQAWRLGKELIAYADRMEPIGPY